jgi:hypothetical protein
LNKTIIDPEKISEDISLNSSTNCSEICFKFLNQPRVKQSAAFEQLAPDGLLADITNDSKSYQAQVSMSM